MAVDYNTNQKVEKKEVQYLGREFSDIRNNLMEFAKTYFPNTYNDFNESSPGMMFIEMAAYVGDVLGFYIDNQYRESLLHAAEEKKNIYKIAQSFGYEPKLSSPATAICDFSVEVPSLQVGETYQPDLDYAPILAGDSTFSSTNGTTFRLADDINFKVSSSLDNMDIRVSKFDETTPTHFTLTKKGICKSGTKTSQTFTFGNATKFDKIILSNNKVIDIMSITDSKEEKWYEVPFLAQDTVFASMENSDNNSPDLTSYKKESPFLLKLIKTAKRFTKYVRSDGKTEIRFGSGISSNADEEIIPNPDNVGSSLSLGVNKLDESFDPSNFLKTKTFGLAPSNTTLTVTYTYGGSVKDNALSGTITNLDNVSWTFDDTGLNGTKVSDMKTSLVITNEESATGGSSGETNEQVRQNALAYFNSQNRAVTKEDYIIRVYSLPQKYGNIAKCFIVQDEQLEENTKLIVKNGKISKNTSISTLPNPLALNFYTLGYDANQNLVTLNHAVKNNLKTYLSQYRILTDAINIKDAYIVNISCRFSIITQRGFNKNEVLLRAIESVKKYFDIKKWQIGQPIILSDIAYAISLVDGVASIVPPEDDNPQKQMVVIDNEWQTESGYTGHVYDLQSATKDGVIYPSLDPCIFELKFPNTDISGRVVGDV
ncbi:hypothetical protein HN615_12650 [Candidatus Woesearchaeota archaeon]|nr:hypothetical protein [Candidatus Woesearchaeota archaeon]